MDTGEPLACDVAKTPILAASALAMLSGAPPLMVASTPEAKPVSFFSENRISPLSDKRLEALLTKKAVIFKHLETGKMRKVYYDSDPKQDVDHLYDQDGREVQWSVVEKMVSGIDEHGIEK